MAKRATILLVDDEEALCNAAERILTKEGYQVTSLNTAQAGLDYLAGNGADLIISDLMLPDFDGIELLRRAKELRPGVEVIIITGHGTVEKAVEAWRFGAYDFITKPLDRVELVKAVGKAVEKQRLAAANEQLRARLQQQHDKESLIGHSPAMVAIKRLLRQVAPTDVSVLIQGESGTGKEVVADYLHAFSTRCDKPIVKISCAAIPETLLESELFGYERGAFTGAAGSKPGKFELADGGTLFLDEIAEMSTQLQAKLLRVLQDGRFQRLGSTRDIQIDVRVISATHVDILEAIEQKKFREDLYYRLNVVHVEMPPLRERPEDIELLAGHFLKKFATRMQKDVRTIASEAIGQLLAHPWPGNVRELENALQRAIAVAADDTIHNFQLAPAAGRAARGGVSAFTPAVTFPVGTKLADAEERLIAATLDQCGGDKEKAAKVLGVSSRTLYRRFAQSK